MRRSWRSVIGEVNYFALLVFGLGLGNVALIDLRGLLGLGLEDVTLLNLRLFLGIGLGFVVLRQGIRHTASSMGGGGNLR